MAHKNNNEVPESKSLEPVSICPLMSRIHLEVDRPDPRLIGAGAQMQVSPIFTPVECQKEKCGFYHRGRKWCSIPFIADLDLLGGIDPRK